MDNIFIVAAVISATFFIAKFIEMRFVEKESKPLKIVVRDSLLVYFSVIIANFILDQLKPMIQNAGGNGQNATPIFTDNPGF
jgi:hypothetical protein